MALYLFDRPVHGVKTAQLFSRLNRRAQGKNNGLFGVGTVRHAARALQVLRCYRRMLGEKKRWEQCFDKVRS